MLPARPRLLSLLVVVAGCLLRFAHLDADPHYYAWYGYMIDEGRWVEHARSLAGSGAALESLESYNLLIAPGFEAATAASFATLGVSRISARLFPALCGSALLILLGWHLWRRASPSGLLLGLAVVAFQADYVVLSRVAVPEAPAMLGGLATFLAIVSGSPHPARLFGAGVLMAGTLALKATTLPLVPILALVAFALRDAPVGLGRRLRDLACFVAGLVGAGIAALLVAILVVQPQLEQLASRFEILRRFVGLNTPYAMLSLPVGSLSAPVLNASALGLWVALLAGFADRGRQERGSQRRLLRSAVIWCVGFAAVMAALSYFPDRYRIHLLTPLALACAHGVTRLEGIGLAGLAAALAGARGLRRLIGGGILGFPIGVLLSAAIAAVLGLLGAPADRLSLRLASLLLGQLAAFAIADRLRRRPSGIAAVLIVSAVWTLLWLGAWAVREGGFAFWPVPPYAPALGAWLGLVAAGALVSAAVWAWWSRTGATRGLAAALAVAWMSIWCVHIAPGFLAPRFTLRDSSRDLGLRLAGTPGVPQYQAEGLFIDNDLPWRILVTATLASELPPVIVTSAPFPEDAGLLADRYERVTSYDLYLPRSYRGPRPARSEADCPGQQGYCVAVYRLRRSQP